MLNSHSHKTQDTISPKRHFYTVFAHDKHRLRWILPILSLTSASFIFERLFFFSWIARFLAWISSNFSARFCSCKRWRYFLSSASFCCFCVSASRLSVSLALVNHRIFESFRDRLCFFFDLFAVSVSEINAVARAISTAPEAEVKSNIFLNTLQGKLLGGSVWTPVSWNERHVGQGSYFHHQMLPFQEVFRCESALLGYSLKLQRGDHQQQGDLAIGRHDLLEKFPSLQSSFWWSAS